MNNVAVAQHHRPAWPDLSEFLSGFPSWSTLRPMFNGHIIKVEDAIADGKYELQAELPGVDPDKDVEITVRGGVLTIKAERSEKKESNGRSEFSYGSFTRSVTLPAGAEEDGIKASYDKGILSVSVPLTEPATPEKRVTVESSK
ncbi:heat shock protein Hsp20 [Mycolicibacterium canariasense]|uniref:Heat shock protein Hsp20 n=1 Tax=Mycolicibacterium canariasense TaxID=228230 RepID=A0A100W8H1_MYCCR|nr:Hsp20/alpha crystallin family protein [Mycolicibacterium canariasense]MCV7213348.1 Hsp20/alpha crystallin family protein [Mycolicibacterium canariasense]ORV10595.1 hypothetical protein AWB94_06720 [Mycolicibacterium canariasense]GAS93612.1 heat shock protein Hsp20 [Mycolicibacterium canariasense]